MRWPLSQPEWHSLDAPQDGYGETDPMEDNEAGAVLTSEQVAANPGLTLVLTNILARYSPEVETCRIVYPTFDLGHEVEVNVGGPFSGIPHLVYATIYRNGHETCRVTAFGRIQ